MVRPFFYCLYIFLIFARMNELRYNAPTYLRLYLALGILLASTVVKGEENPKIKELEHELISANEDTAKVNILIQLAQLTDWTQVILSDTMSLPSQVESSVLF